MDLLPDPPERLGRSGAALWTEVLAEFELSEHELALLRETCRTADSIDQLQQTLDAEGVMSESSQGVRVHPALVELRQQRITLARLFAALSLPTGEQGAGSATHRPPRGVYGIRGAV